MKVNELTIGSLVRTNKGEIIRVESISTNKQRRKLGYHEQGDNCHIKYVRLTQVEGITLSEDILQKLGWKKQSTKDCSYYWHSAVPFCIPIRGFESNAGDKMFSNDYFDSVFIRMNYYHELQRELYGCGLYKMVDSLDIEQI